MTLDEKEQQTLALLIADMPAKEIGIQLGYPSGGVLDARGKILQKLGVGKLELAAVVAIKKNILGRLQGTPPKLNARQKSILRYIAANMHLTVIAKKVGLGRKGLSGEIRELYRLFGVHTTPQLMLAAASYGLV